MSFILRVCVVCLEGQCQYTLTGREKEGLMCSLYLSVVAPTIFLADTSLRYTLHVAGMVDNLELTVPIDWAVKYQRERGGDGGRGLLSESYCCLMVA